MCFNLAHPASHHYAISNKLMHHDRMLTYLNGGEGADASEASVERAGFDGGLEYAGALVLVSWGCGGTEGPSAIS